MRVVLVDGGEVLVDTDCTPLEALVKRSTQGRTYETASRNQAGMTHPFFKKNDNSTSSPDLETVWVEDAQSEIGALQFMVTRLFTCSPTN